MCIARNEKLTPNQYWMGTVYASDQVHHCFFKAMKMCGFPRNHLRVVPTNKSFQMDLECLSKMLEEDRVAGFVPFMVIGSFGTTNTGAVDDLHALSDIANKNNLWFHVDAAYGGLFVLTGEGGHVSRGIEQADSITLDPHKSMFFPYGTGCLLVKHHRVLSRMYTDDAESQPYLLAAGIGDSNDSDNVKDSPDDLPPLLVNFADISPEQTRPARGLRVWIALKLTGIDPFVTALEERLRMVRNACDSLETKFANNPTQIDKQQWILEITSRPSLSVFCFRFRMLLSDSNSELEAHSDHTEQENEINASLLEEVNGLQRCFLQPTKLRGAYVLRVIALSIYTRQENMDWLVEDIEAALLRLANRN
eukprot:c11061_g1_i1.p1 GENE.c11061_g1_i1~~c11061_g1_i1.p1  ORF type:complete len:364 (+),score=94.32 c11061_g1_i1:639-1730(+)